MTMTPWDYLVNGSLLQAAYQTYNQPFTFHGIQNYPIGILFIVFMILFFIQVQDVGFHFIVSLVFFSVFFAFIPPLIKIIIITVLLFELTGIIYDWVAD